MKKKISIIAIALYATLSLVSCKQKNLNPYIIQTEVMTLSDSLVNKLDVIVDSLVQYYSESGASANIFEAITLTESEKAAKPDYLLDPASVRELVTYNQKLTALGYMLVDRLVLELYDMPTSKTDAAIRKLMLDVNVPLSIKEVRSLSLAQIIRSEYDRKKSGGDVFSFWILFDAIMTETDYIIACNPNLFSSRLTAGMWADLSSISLYDAASILAPYNDRLALSKEGNRAVWGDFYGQEVDENFDIAAAVRSYYERRDAIKNLRNSLLK